MTYLHLSTINHNHDKNYYYIYECTGSRKGKKVIINKNRVGTYDPVNKIAIFNDDYLEKLNNIDLLKQKLPVGYEIVSQYDYIKRHSNLDLSNCTIKDFGFFYLMEHISNQIGLIDSLSSALPVLWKDVFMLSCYLVSSGEPFQHCADWINDSEGYNVGEMSSQYISSLLRKITEVERNKFYQYWAENMLKQEYFALDVSSTSSYSELIDDVEFGYNRDKEKLPQINICMLMGEKSLLPIYIMNYQGSLNDVKILENTINLLSSITKTDKYSLVMDKGFYSEKNISFLLNKHKNMRFIISVPFTCNLAKEQLSKYRDAIFSISNAIIHNDKSLYTISDKYFWNNVNTLNVYNFYNHIKYTNVFDNNLRDALQAQETALKNPLLYYKNSDYLKFLDFKQLKNSNDQFIITISDDKLKKLSRNAGWLSFISNDNLSNNEILNIYRNKDIVEKGFLRLKGSLDLYKTIVKSQEALNNKIFISFTALILLSKIHQIMISNNLYKNFTITKLINETKRFKKIMINDCIVYSATTKIQNDIFTAFNVDLSTINLKK
ncbi:MAG: IS1634 family transposase [Deltaproteobacteria bacterium]|jgi:transposase|nr:IS1634 family transposase [Deltaproteobacteria bacterium]